MNQFGNCRYLHYTLLIGLNNFAGKVLQKQIMTIPKFKNVREKRKDVHAHEFRDFIDSVYNMC